MDTAILPLAITMMAGPQILSAIIFATSRKPVLTSAAFTIGVAVAVTLGVAVAAGLAGVLGDRFGSDSSGPSTLAKTVQIGLIGLLVLLSLRTYWKRESIQPPKWIGKLQEASAGRAFVVAMLLILFFPSDVAILLTTGVHLESHNLSLTAAIPFIAMTTAIAALPLIVLVLFHKRAKQAVPKFREWMNENIWLVNIIVYVVFIFLILD